MGDPVERMKYEEPEWVKELKRRGRAVSRLDAAFEKENEVGLRVTEIRVKLGRDGGYLVVVKARANDQRFVGFSGGDTAADALKNAANAIDRQVMKWKPDEWAEGKWDSPLTG
jgi:hypothetical protein